MNKTWVAVIVFFVCVVGILGTFYDSQAEAAADIVLSGHVSYTDEELQELYEKYDITENDLKFARGELPNYLEGTVFQSNSRVLVTETGEPPEGSKEGVDYDVVMREQEMSKIMEETRAAYIEKYGVDPANPKLDEVDGRRLPYPCTGSKKTRVSLYGKGRRVNLRGNSMKKFLFIPLFLLAFLFTSISAASASEIVLDAEPHTLGIIFKKN